MSLTPKFHNEQTHDLLLSLDEAQTPMEQVQVQAEREALDELAAGIATLDVQLESNAEILKSNAQLLDSNAQLLDSNAQLLDSNAQLLESNAQLLESMDRRLESIDKTHQEIMALHERTQQHIKDLCDLFGLRVEDIYTDQPLPAPISTSLTTPIPVNKMIVNTMRPILAKNASLTLLQWCSALLKRLWHCLQRKSTTEQTATKDKLPSLFSAERHPTETPPATVTTIAAAPGA